MQIHFLIVNISVRVNNFSFKYICVVCYLKLCFYCLAWSFTGFRDFNSCLQDISSRRLQDMSSTRLQDTSSRRLQDMSSRRLEDQQIFAG